MPSPKTLQVISSVSNLSYRTSFGMLPLLCEMEDKNVHSPNSKTFKQAIVILSYLLGVIVVVAQLIRCKLDNESKNSVEFLFYSFQLAVLLFEIIYGAGLSFRFHEFRCLFRNMAKSPNGLVICKISD